ncbi:hypothetical protein DM01DRAFT_1284329 [Hesseltinella vesiculosa]|uniref:B box-type domain-containing protein n=1 Tax=Hesseltinella vesiculosa TaxID=101127 RepID=A0A1X2GPB4_9FUNG|nr:hypothetical protein DM01DRAFT_1284329 [Hesseltinella vesiculosa]
MAQTQASVVYCIECSDQEATVFCEQCDEDFCEVCHGMLHRTGQRRKHTAKNLQVSNEAMSQELDEAIKDADQLAINGTAPSVLTGLSLDGTIIANGTGATFGEWLTKRAKYVPLRLDTQERALLRLLEAALNVSEYTDRVDILSYSNKAKRIVHQIKDVCYILSGLLVTGDYKLGARLFAENSTRDNEAFFQQVFEVGRRYKIMNPEKLRSNYGKLMYMLMDSVIPEVEQALGFQCVVPIKTVYSFLKERQGLELLHDDHIALATREISPEFKSRDQVQAEIQRKRLSIDTLCKTYATDQLTVEDIERCLASLSDNHSYLKANRDPCDKMIKYLTKYFHPNTIETGYSLAITAGRHGHRLTHTHASQYYYVHQSLTLWREIVHDMFMLWTLADDDMTSSGNPYRLTNTGQGLNRIQPCHQVSKTIHKILHRAQKKCGSWVGSSVIHLGDKNVPNAFMFIDKYNQVSRILAPIVLALDKLDAIQDEELVHYIEAMYGSVDQCRKDILFDFFRFGFDGSGGDNYFDAGSWCSQIEKKKYFPIFLLTGFIGFDGK